MTVNVNDLLVHHGRVIPGVGGGTKRVIIHLRVRPSGVFIDLMEAAADTIHGIDCVLRSEEYDQEIILVVSPGIRASDASRAWIREVNSRVRSIHIELREQLDGRKQDDPFRGLAVYSDTRGFGDGGE